LQKSCVWLNKSLTATNEAMELQEVKLEKLIEKEKKTCLRQLRQVEEKLSTDLERTKQKVDINY